MCKSLFSLLLGLLSCSDDYELLGPESTAPITLPDNPSLAAQYQTDTFEQTGWTKTDVLFVVDNSCSMGEEQADLSSNAAPFMEYMLGLDIDYHVGAITADNVNSIDQGRLRPTYEGNLWIDAETYDPILSLESLLVLGTGAFSDEMGLLTTNRALTEHRDVFNAGFFRADADLHIIVISDEDDYSGIPTGTVLTTITSQRVFPYKETFSSIVKIPDSYSPCMFSIYAIGYRYIKMTELVGGYIQDLCESDWMPVMNWLSTQVLSPQVEFPLSKVPVPESILVQTYLGGVTFAWSPDTDWIYNYTRNSIIFLYYVPADEEEVVITYEVQ